jgi:flagellar biosynthesis GTPase FlhF
VKLVSFVAENANAALAQIQEKLGSDAIVVSVRRLPAHGLSRLWHKGGHIEVLACAPEAAPIHKVHTVPPGVDAYVPFADKVESDVSFNGRGPRRWRSVAWLESLGLLTPYADQLEAKVSTIHGNEPPEMPIAEWKAVRSALMEYWHSPRPSIQGDGRPHVFVGPCGSGKTTVLCKWMTAAVLTEERTARVSRLDGASANTAEFLNFYCETVGVPMERFWTLPNGPTDLLFVDLPGIESHDRHAMEALREQVALLPNPHVHLVLNGAYDIGILLDQFQAFSMLAPEDLIFTHLDEEHHRVKLWNFVLGTKCSISFLSAGQKIPGEFLRADSALLFPCEKAQ